jgi:hypothetical protein
MPSRGGCSLKKEPYSFIIITQETGARNQKKKEGEESVDLIEGT